MKILDTKNWSIAKRLIAITVLPAVLMFISVVAWSYYARYTEVYRDLEERGALIATMLAESSQYGVISGNLSEVERTVHGLLRQDKSIYRIDVYDRRTEPVISMTNGPGRADQLLVSEAPIRRETVAVNPFDESGGPHLSAPAQFSSAVVPLPDDVVGYVRISMSPAILLANKLHRILAWSGVAGLLLLVSGAVGLALARQLTRPLSMMIATLRQIRSGNYEVKLNEISGGEIGDLQRTIVDMTESLTRFRCDMKAKVHARTRDLQQARDEAMRVTAENRRLIQIQNSAIEEERRHIAVEIHDHLNASLIVIRLEAQRILGVAEREQLAQSAEQLKRSACSIIDLTSMLYDKARDIVKRLRPEMIDTLGLQVAVEEMIRHVDAIHPSCRFEFYAQGDLSTLNADLAIPAYRLVQEALSNVVKHAQASKATVGILLDESNRVLRIVVTDNGRSFDPAARTDGIGLIGMRERVFGLGGTIEIDARPGSGTTVTINLPIAGDTTPPTGQSGHAGQ